MKPQTLLTLEQVRTKVRLEGKTFRQVAREVTDWLEAKGITPAKPVNRHTVNAVLSGHHRGDFGNAHWVAVYLRLKPECAEAHLDMPIRKRTRTRKATPNGHPSRRHSDRGAQA